MVRKRIPPHVPVEGDGVEATDKLAQVVQLLESLKERQEQMALDLSQLKDGITLLAEQVAAAVTALKDEQQQQADVDQLADQAHQLGDQLAAVLSPPVTPPPEPTTPAAPSSSTPAAPSSSTPAAAPARGAAAQSQTLIDAARQRREAATKRPAS